MKPILCLNMIVKDEAHVIERCLASVKPLIDYWVIVDTGSTDGTQNIIREFLKEIPGELHERPFVNFEASRNAALELARGKGDYFLFIDADDRLVIQRGYTLPKLDKDFYIVQQHMKCHGEVYQPVVFLLKDRPEYKWIGAVHETLNIDFSKGFGILDGIINEYLHDGARSKDANHFEKDIQMLKDALRQDPMNFRNMYYLAQSYVGAGQYELAIPCFEKRAAAGDDSYEIYFCYYYKAILQMRLRYPADAFLNSFSKAFLVRPSRAEPLFQIASYFLEKENYFLAYLVGKLGVSIPKPIDVYVEPFVYEEGMRDRYQIAMRNL